MCHVKGIALEKYGLGEYAKSKEKNLPFPHGISPVNLHHLAWVDGYVHAGQLAVQAVQVSRSTGGVGRGGRSIYNDFCDIPRDISVADRGDM